MPNPYNYQRPAGAVAINRKKVATIPPKVNRSQQDVYLEQKIMSARPEELTLMLYEGLVKFIKLAKHFVGEKNIAKVRDNTIRAQDIVLELRATLNMDYPIAKKLDSLYDFIFSRLVDGNLKQQEKPFSEALEIAEELYDTWKQAMSLI